MAKVTYELTHTTLPEWSLQSLPEFEKLDFDPESEGDATSQDGHLYEHGRAVEGVAKDDFLHGCLIDDEEDGERIAYRPPTNLDIFDMDSFFEARPPVALDNLNDVLNEAGVDAPVMMKTRFVIDPSAIRGVQKVHKLLGVGTFTEVYHCSFENRDGVVSEVALKLYDQYVRPGETELALMSELRHPNLLSLHDVIDGLPCGLALEFCAGGSLHDFLHGHRHRETSQRCTVQTRLRAVHGVACALQYLHSYNIIHRDVKSGNCLLVEETEKGVMSPMKLGDLGFAREVSQDCMTRWRGAVRYMSPDMMESNDYDVSADIFSFGILLHELLSGQVPYSDMNNVNEARLAMHICAGGRPSLEIFSTFGACAEICSVIRQTWGLPANRPPACNLATQIEELIRIA